MAPSGEPKEQADAGGRGCLHTLFCLLFKLLVYLRLISEDYYHRRCACTVGIVAVSFNHDSSSLSADAMNVRRNFTAEVSAPEWTTGKTQATDSPAAYAIKETQGHTITIKVKFTISPTAFTQAEIKADGGGVLGAIDSQTVAFSNGVSVPEFVPVELHHHTIGNDGIKLEDIIWNWQYRCPGETTWRQMQATSHRI